MAAMQRLFLAMCAVLPTTLMIGCQTTPAGGPRSGDLRAGAGQVPRGQTTEDYTRAIERSPDDANAYFGRGFLHSLKGEDDEALRDYTRCVELAPDHAAAYENRGTARYRKGLYDQAVQDYTRCIELNPDYAVAYENRGIAYSQVGRYDEAVRDYTRAIELQPRYPKAYNNRAMAHYRLGDYAQAWADVKGCRDSGGTPDPQLLELLSKSPSR
jgi:tetratricopeptide (TPR) repeat protein